MKTFIFAVCIFILCGALVFFNSAYITSKAGELSERADKLPDSPNDYERIYTELNNKWHKLRPVMCITVSHTEAGEIDDALDEIAQRARSGDVSGYRAAVGKLKKRLDEVSRSETLSLEGIL